MKRCVIFLAFGHFRTQFYKLISIYFTSYFYQVIFIIIICQLLLLSLFLSDFLYDQLIECIMLKKATLVKSMY